MIKQPHLDKIKQEVLLHERYGIVSSSFNKDGKQTSKAGLYDSSKLVILRPALLTDGKAKLELRSAEGILPSAWNISRRDVGAYIANNCLSVGSKVIKEHKVPDAATSWKGGLVLAY
jgi:hypothetical protein